jgi:hypothetical protein
MRKNTKKARKEWDKKFKKMHENNDDEMIIKDRWMSEEYVKQKLGLLNDINENELDNAILEARRKNDEIDEKKEIDITEDVSDYQSRKDKEEILLVKFLIDCDLTSILDGRCVWINMVNRNIEVNGIPLQNGSMRTLGQLISAVCGGSYMDYYCATEKMTDIERVWKIMEEHGAKIVNDLNSKSLKKKQDH